jgi:hypothetical protein
VSTAVEAPSRSATSNSGIVRVALALAYISSATIPWNGWKYGLRPGDAFLLLALLVFFAADLGRVWPKLPPWVWQFGALIFLVTILHEVLPTDPFYLEHRLVISGPTVIRGNVEIQGNLQVGLKFLVPVIGLPMMYRFALLHDPRALYRGAAAFVLGTAISAFVGFSDLLGVTHLSLSLTKRPALGGRAPGLTLHPNFLAMTCVLALPFVLWELRSPRLRSRVFALLLLLALVVGLYASGSRAGAGAGPAAALLSFVVMPRYRDILPTVALLTGGAAAVVFALNPSIGASLLHAVRLSGGDNSVSGSDSQRAIVHHQGYLDFLHSPIDGVGMQVAEEAHNVYLQALAAGGILLFVGYVIFLLSGILTSLNRMKIEPLAYPLFVSAVAGGVFVFVQAALTDRLAYVPLGLIAAMPAAGLDAAGRPTAVDEPS